MSFADVNGVRVVEGTVCIPWRGLWAADLALATDAPAVPNGPATLTLGDLTLSGTVSRSDAFGGQTTLRMVAGAGGWGKTLKERFYALPPGVPLSMVLGDAAAEAGEVLSAAARAVALSVTLGAFAVRAAGPPSVTVLRQWAEPNWWVDNAGQLQLGDRASTPASGNAADAAHLGAVMTPFTVLDNDAGKHRLLVATDNPADWMPGRTFTAPNVPGGAQTISMVTHALRGDGGHRLSVLLTDP